MPQKYKPSHEYGSKKRYFDYKKCFIVTFYTFLVKSVYLHNKKAE